MVRRVVTFFDKLEDKVRAKLSRWPIVYSLVGAIGIILMWKGIWEMAEQYQLLHGFGSVALGTSILLMSGLLVSFYIGDSVILSGLKRDKKFTEKTDKEILAAEKAGRAEVLAKLEHIEADIHALRGEPAQEEAVPQEPLLR